MLQHRADLAEKRFEASDARMARIEQTLAEMRTAIATREDLARVSDAVGRWGLTLFALIIATGIGVAAAVLQASNNQLAAFQAGLSTIEAVASGQAVRPPASPAR